MSEREEEDDLAVLALEGVQRDESTILAPRERGMCNMRPFLFDPIFRNITASTLKSKRKV